MTRLAVGTSWGQRRAMGTDEGWKHNPRAELRRVKAISYKSLEEIFFYKRS